MKDVYRDAPVGELHDPLLPRWFVLLALAMVPVALVVVVLAFRAAGPEDVPVAARRPPPAAGLTHDVGQVVVGETLPQPHAEACPMLQGVHVAGEEADRAQLRRAIAGLCNAQVEDVLRERLEGFAAAGGVVRFAVFERTGVDSAALLDADPPAILVNAKFTQTDPLWIAPLLAHDATVLAVGPGSAEAAVEARRAEHTVCERLLAARRPSRACEDAAELLALPDPLAALREAGYR